MLGRSCRAENQVAGAGFLAVSLLSLAILAFPAAASTADDVQVVSNSDIKQLLKQARKHYEKGRWDEAENVYRRIIEISPSNTTAKLELAYLYVKERRIGEAYAISYAAAQADNTNARACAVLGATFLTAGKFPEARACFIKSLSLSRKEDIAWAGIGMLDFYENRIDRSIANLREASFRKPEEPDYYFALGQVSARAEKYKEAAEAYKSFLATSNDIDSDRRGRIKGLINFLHFLGQKTSLYDSVSSSETTIPMRLVGNRPVIQLRINEKDEPLNFVLDTGSGISVISDKTAKKLGLRAITRGGFAKGIGGNGRFEIVYGFIRNLSIGDVQIRNVPVYIREFHAGTEEIDGYIGLSVISKFLTTIDYGNHTFALTKRSEEPDRVVESELSLPLRLTSSGFLSGEVKLEGIDNTFNFIVDTGASVSVISDELAGSEEVSRYPQGEKMRVIGSAGVTEDVPSFTLPKVTFGPHSRERVAAIALDLDLINEASGFQQAGILGGNFLRNYRLTFDFRNSKVTFEPVGQNK